ncbi:MAG: hypothetical protein LC790_01150 [Actinobacteria bacterium]|nr:hypothetical protein [Actinomycetota bacterium]MCA1697571.1 hypothetical protein [Actinomycetota bacterium]
MPRTVQDILDHADELARRFENYEPAAEEARDPQAFVALRDAVITRSEAERSVKAAVDHARARGYSWELIGSLLGTTGEAARQRYGAKQEA